MNNEIWKDVTNYEGLYQVSNLGRVKSIGYGTERILKLVRLKNGYLKVSLWKNSKNKQFLVHRIVAQAFLSNPQNLSQVNHKDEDKTNNSVQNLEWCDQKYNHNYGTINQRISEKMTNGKLSKPVLQYTKTGEFVRKWKSTKDVERNLGYSQSYISKCCNGKRNSANGFIWKYK